MRICNLKTLTYGLIILLTTIFIGCATWQASEGAQVTAERVYYVEANGDDGNSGLSPGAAWKTIERVNQAVFKPGDAILFRAGDVWHGQMQPKGSGTAGKPIRLGRFGKGAMPVIDLDAATGAAVKLINQKWWIIQDLEVTSGTPPEAWDRTTRDCDPG